VSERPVLYLDVDDTLIMWNDAHPYGKAAPWAREFVLWAVEHCEVRWLTMWCPAGRMAPHREAELALLLVSPEYRAALLASRRQMGALDLDTARTIARAVAQWADELARWLLSRPDDPRRTSVAASREVIYRSALAMDQRIREAAAANRTVLFDDVLAMWQQAGLDVAARKDIPNALLGAVRSPPMTLLDAWANRPGAANWQTLIQGHVANAAQEADAIVGAAIRNGASMQDLARNLQRYVKGSEAFQDAFKAVKRADGSEVWRLDRGAITPELRGAAARCGRNASGSRSRRSTARGGKPNICTSSPTRSSTPSSGSCRPTVGRMNGRRISATCWRRPTPTAWGPASSRSTGCRRSRILATAASGIRLERSVKHAGDGEAAAAAHAHAVGPRDPRRRRPHRRGQDRIREASGPTSWRSPMRGRRRPGRR
jgi:hypothetical protein